jgi:hypothetical protein
MTTVACGLTEIRSGRRRQRRGRRRFAFALVCASALLCASGPAAGAVGAHESTSQVPGISADLLSSKAAGTVLVPLAAPTSYQLSTTVTGGYIEARGSATTAYDDSVGNWYKDRDFAEMCSDGSGAVMMYYWEKLYPSQTYPNVTGTSGYFKEPWTSADWKVLNATTHPTFQDSQKRTNWSTSRARGYMAYLSMQVNPGGMFAHPGLDLYHSRSDGRPVYPQWGSDPDWMTYALAWESSNHTVDPEDGTYFWAFKYKGSSTLAADLNNAVATDVGTLGVPVQARVNAKYLTKNWPSGTGNVGHAIVIVGYNNSTHTYTYIDTYYPYHGVFTDTQAAIVTAMQNFPGSHAGSPVDGGFIW